MDNRRDLTLGFFRSPWRRILQPLSALYSLLVRFRRWYVTSGEVRLAVPVISVGNITVGGTGKTPVVEMIVRELRRRGRHPAILSRGYRGRQRGDRRRANDEFLVLAENLPDIPHIQDPRRVRAGREAIAGGADVLVLDDGFQHVALGRDLDLVLIDAVNPFGFGRVLPTGLLREPLETLEKADLLVLTRIGATDPQKAGILKSYLRWRWRETPLIEVDFEPVEWVSIDEDKQQSLEELCAQPCLAFAGIGNPEGFRRELERLKLVVAEWIPFSDHYRYTLKDVERLSVRAREMGARALVLTQKDAVKIQGLDHPRELPWYYLRIRPRVRFGKDTLEGLLDKALMQK